MEPAGVRRRREALERSQKFLPNFNKKIVMSEATGAQDPKAGRRREGDAHMRRKEKGRKKIVTVFLFLTLVM